MPRGTTSTSWSAAFALCQVTALQRLYSKLKDYGEFTWVAEYRVHPTEPVAHVEVRCPTRALRRTASEITKAGRRRI